MRNEEWEPLWIEYEPKGHPCRGDAPGGCSCHDVRHTWAFEFWMAVDGLKRLLTGGRCGGYK